MDGCGAVRYLRAVPDGVNWPINWKLFSKLYLVINDYSSGTVEIRVHNGDNYLIYSSVLDYNTSGIFKEFDGYQPKIITIKFVDFTGKFKVTLVDRD